MLSLFNEDDWLETQLSHNGHGQCTILALLRANLCDVVLVDTLSFRVDVACLIRTVSVAINTKKNTRNVEARRNTKGGREQRKAKRMVWCEII